MRPTRAHEAADPDDTAELPLPQFAAGVEDELSRTGEWAPPDATGDAAGGEAVAALTSVLREKSFALARLEREVEALRAENRRLRLAEPPALAGLQQRLAEVERERVAVATQHDEQRARLAAAEESLAALRDARASLEARLAETESALAAREHQLAAAGDTQARLGAELAGLRRELEARTREVIAAGLEQADRARRLALEAELRRRDAQVARLLERLRWREARRHFGEVAAGQDGRPPPPGTAGDDAGPAPRPALAKRYLVRVDLPGAPVQVLAKARIGVGRGADNELRVDEVWMSRHHAVLRLGPEDAFVEDAGSTNGVWLNERRVRRERLRDGDVIGFGTARFRFHEQRPSGARD